MTILIPTRERAAVLAHSLHSAVDQDYPNLEIIVCDNASVDDTRAVVDSFACERIRYVNPGKRLSMSRNWEFGLSHVRDGWVTILGDDDAILPGAIERAMEIARATGVKAIRSDGADTARFTCANQQVMSLGVRRSGSTKCWERRRLTHHCQCSITVVSYTHR